MDQNFYFMFYHDSEKAHGKVIFNKKALMDYGGKYNYSPVLRLGLSALETMVWKEELL